MFHYLKTNYLLSQSKYRRLERLGSLSTSEENEKCQQDTGGEGKVEMWNNCLGLSQSQMLLQ